MSTTRNQPYRHPRRLQHAVAALLGVLAFVLTASLATHVRADPLFAGDNKTFVATMCRAVVGTPGTLRYEQDGSIVNDSLFDHLHVVCPLVRDATQTLNNQFFSISVVDNNPIQDVECTATSRGPFNATVAFASGSSEGSGDAVQAIEISVFEHAKDGYGVLDCRIPPLNQSTLVPSRIITYAVNETSVFKKNPSTDSKTYTGTFAESGGFLAFPIPENPIEYDDIGAATRTADPGVYSWVLPLIRDTVASDWNRVRLRVFDDDPAPDMNFTCAVLAFTEMGEDDPALSMFCSDEDPAPEAFGERTLVCKPPEPEIFGPGADDGPYVVFCFPVPSTSIVFMYDIREKL